MIKLTHLLSIKSQDLINKFLSNPDAIKYLDLITYKSSAGSYGFSNLGILIIKKITKIIREVQNEIGTEISISCISNSDIYKKSGRTNRFQIEMFNITDQLCLQPTCEESAIQLLINNGISYKSLPLYFYQINKKFRKEIRPRNNILRCLEFDMKDGYSFHTSNKCAIQFYQKIKESYYKIFKILGIKTDLISSDTESMLAVSSEEFIYKSDRLIETKKQDLNGIEIAHIFQLGNHYSERLNILYTNHENKFNKIFMNSYGIGIYRLLYIYLDKLVCMNLKRNLAIFDICLISQRAIIEYQKLNINEKKIIEFNIENIDIYKKIQMAKYLPINKIILYYRNMIIIMLRDVQNFISYVFEESNNLLNLINLKLNL